jgi:hypothetical protein
MFGSLGSMLGGSFTYGNAHNNQNMGQSNYQGMLNGYNSQQAQNMLAQQYNQAMMKPKPKWVIDGKEFNSVRDVANELYPTDCPEKTFFILKYE